MFQVHCERPSTGQIWDMIALGEIRVDKAKNEPASLQGDFLRDYMTVENDDVIAVQLNEQGMDDVNLFYGYVKDTDKSDDIVSVTAYDQLFALQLSTEIKVYGTVTASDLYKQISDEHKLFMLDPPNVVDSEYPVPDVIADGSTPLDLLTETLNSTYAATGKQYYIFDFFKNLCMEEQENYRIPKENYEFNGENIESYHLTEDASKRINEVVVKSNDDASTVLAVRRDEAEIEAHGAITKTVRIKDGENPDAIADELFNSSRTIVPEMSLSIYGCNPQVVPGRLIHVDLFTARKEYVYGWYSVESCSYVLSGGSGNMDVKLKFHEMESEVFGT